MKLLLNLFIALFFFTTSHAQKINQPRVYEIWDNKPALNRGGDYNISKAHGVPYDEDWELESYGIGNGYMGANIFGRTDVERIQITEKTLFNKGLYGIGGMTSFAELNFNFNHNNPTNYKRTINLNKATATVSYTHNNVEYNREHFISYPDNVMVIKLTANQKNKINFTLHPKNPYVNTNHERNTRTGKIETKDNLITLSGSIPHFGVNYEGQIKILKSGGTLENLNENIVKVNNANSVTILISAGTNYKLDADVFTKEIDSIRLDNNIFPHEKISNQIKKAEVLGYGGLYKNHINDYTKLFSRVQLVFNDKISVEPTNNVLEAYKKDPSNHYLEELMFHYGRYLLISTSRKGALPCGLQGVWSQYEVTPFTGGFWHNINVQMNYWGAFNTNLAETFIPYIEYHKAYRPSAELLATQYLSDKNINFDKNTDNGWTIGTGATPYKIQGPGVHSGPGTGALTTKLFWDYYEFTMDTIFLKEDGYPAIKGMSKFLSKTLEKQDNGTLLVNPSASPEQKHHGEHYITKGTTFDQTLVWENNNDLLKAAKILKIKDPFLEKMKAENEKLNPIIIGKSGQIKEYIEEEFYGDIGQKEHRHISHLCALYPGTLINSNTPNWLEASKVTLDKRGNISTGWAMAHRMNLRARTKQGNIAHDVLTKFIQLRTLPNLWTTHPPFQIDGNFGSMAGIAEMLIQSHEGYIDPLAALPNAWKNGFYQGLIARGNFEVSTKWKKGKASFIKIKSNKGGICKLRYKDIKSIVQIETNANVSFKNLNNDVISFETEKHQEYKIVLQ